MFLFLLLLPALWVCLIPLFFATPLYTVQELPCLCKVTFLASPISVRQPQHLPPKQPLLSPPIWHTLSLASCVETGTVTCWTSFHFHTSNSAVNTLPLEANNLTFLCLSSLMDKTSCWIIVNNKCPSCSKIIFTKTGNESLRKITRIKSLLLLRVFSLGIHLPSCGTLNRKQLHEGEFTTGSQLAEPPELRQQKSPLYMKERNF